MQLRITTPEGRVLEREVDALTAPGQAGEMMLLPGHRPMVSALRAGTVLPHATGAEVAPLAISGGVLQVVAEDTTSTTVEILAFASRVAADVDREACEAELRTLSEELASATPERQVEVQQALAWAQAQLAL